MLYRQRRFALDAHVPQAPILERLRDFPIEHCRPSPVSLLGRAVSWMEDVSMQRAVFGAKRLRASSWQRCSWMGIRRSSRVALSSS